MLAAIDCADEANQQVCTNFGITGFPTLKVRAACAGHLPGFTVLCLLACPALAQSDQLRYCTKIFPLGLCGLELLHPSPKHNCGQAAAGATAG